MSEDVRQFWQGYVDSVKPLMRLWHWTITVSDAAPQSSIATASILAEDIRFHADLHLAPDFFDESPEQQRYVVAHELTHLHWWWYMKSYDELSEQLGLQASNATHGQRRRLLELATDETAKIIAELLPLPFVSAIDE